MDSRIQTLLEDYADLLEMHGEYAEMIDVEDIETREIWEQIEADLKQLSRRIASVRHGREVQDGVLEDAEWQIENLNDLYGDLAALFGSDAAAEG